MDQVTDYTIDTLRTIPTCTHIQTIQDGVIADEVAKVNGHQAICDEFRRHIHWL